ncbi:hypothetical protein RB601_006532 [Gaeumannomyces tritici]
MRCIPLSRSQGLARSLGFLSFLLALPSLGQAVDVDYELLDRLDKVNDTKSYYADLHPCPTACTGPSSNWTIYTSFDRFKQCDEPVLLTFALSYPVTSPDTPTKIPTCTLDNANTQVNSLFNGTGVDASPASSKSERNKAKGSLRRQAGVDMTCEQTTSRAQAKESKLPYELAVAGKQHDLDETRRDAPATVIEKLVGFFKDQASCSETIMFAYYRGVAAGIHLGASFGRGADALSAVSKPLIDKAKSASGSTVALQLCGYGRNVDHVSGLAVDTAGDIDAIQAAVEGWSEAMCLRSSARAEPAELTVREDGGGFVPLGVFLGGLNATFANSTRDNTISAALPAALGRRADCKTETVVTGDSCWALASKCGVSLSDFVGFNGGESFCNTLQPKQRVCCSSGSLPDIRPKKGADGTCATYMVVNGDTCAGIASANGLRVSDIEKLNRGTWCWYDRKKPPPNVNICLSEGDRPLPYQASNAVCGPTMLGTKKPTDGTELKDLKPCPLNAYCNVRGQCGVSAEFCTEEKSSSGNPGTSALQNRCVSSCGMEIKNNKNAPNGYGRIGYYEAWNYGRPCLHQRVRNANTDGTYTKIHWTFAEINIDDHTVKIVDPYHQWESFKKGLGRAKRIISFGGWGYSNNPGTYNILREAMQNRNVFATNVAKFLNDEGLDGTGPTTLKFLTVMKSKLSGKQTLSIAAPASYWYLKAFPIGRMAAVLDYIVYMTYDLHGQWDTGNQWATEGCPAGDCVRSHVNLTETTRALVMITKARCFDHQDLPPGRCTDTAGYISNAEIDEIMMGASTSAGAQQVQVWHNGAPNSDMAVYNGDEWVAYMTPTTKGTRHQLWKDMMFAGTIDWATDLQAFNGEDEYLDPRSPTGGRVECQYCDDRHCHDWQPPSCNTVRFPSCPQPSPLTHDWTQLADRCPPDYSKWSDPTGAEATESATGIPRDAVKFGEAKKSGDAQGRVEAVAPLAFTLETAVNAIQSISDAMDVEEAEQRKSTILLFLTAIFLLVPIVGEIAAVFAPLAAIGRIVSILGASRARRRSTSAASSTQRATDLMTVLGIVLVPPGRLRRRPDGQGGGPVALRKLKMEPQMDIVRKVNERASTCMLPGGRGGKRSAGVFPEGALPMSGLNADPFHRW